MEGKNIVFKGHIQTTGSSSFILHMRDFEFLEALVYSNLVTAQRPPGSTPHFLPNIVAKVVPSCL